MDAQRNVRPDNGRHGSGRQVAAGLLGSAGRASPKVVDDSDLRALQKIVEGTAHGTGEEFFRSLVRHLASAIDVNYAVVAQLAPAGDQIRTLAFWARDHIEDNFAYDFAGTPCESVVRGQLCHCPTGVSERFPRAKPLVDNGIDSYLGLPFLDGDGNFLGHLAVFDERPMPAEPRRLFIMRIFAARTTAELERLRAEKRVCQSEQRYRDLYEEAPVGYVSVGTDGRIRSVNRRATQWIGYTADELVGSPIFDICADGPTGKARAAEAFQSFLAGVETCGQEIELCRKDGRPLWISLWSKPLRGEDGAIQVSRSIWVDITDRVLAEAERARLQQQNLYLQDEIKADHNIEEVVGQSAALKAVLDSVRRVAPTDASVLIGGETGTGKELIARAVHSYSKRQDKPFIKINCAALPTGLVESELFGHEKGAFTGASSRRIGRFELADGGTIFLDEVGDIPAESQAKLLRVLQEHEFDRVGGSAPIRVDVRVLAASNRDLLKAVRAQAFREDLYYRLSVFPIHLPPLRERTEDIPLLVKFLIDKFSRRLGKRIDGVSTRTMQRLLAYPWPGNVRELENVLERAVILAVDTILEFDLGVASATPTAPTAAGQSSLEIVEREHILSVLQQTGWVIEGPGGAAGILGLHPSTLRHRMKKLGLHRAS